MEKSVLTKNQKIKLERKKIKYYGEDCFIYPTIGYDDECNNGHNTFSITCDIKNLKGIFQARGCLHDEFEKAYPEYAHLIKWHLCSSDEPLYYIDNTLYWVKKGNLEAAKKIAIWQNASDDVFKCSQLELTRKLLNRLPKLMKEFRKDIEALGFTY